MIMILARVISWISLIVLTGSSFLFLAGRMELQQVKLYMIVSTVVWFITATMWDVVKKPEQKV